MNIVTVPECIQLFYNCRDCGIKLLPVRSVNGEWTPAPSPLCDICRDADNKHRAARMAELEAKRERRNERSRAYQARRNGREK